MTDEEKNLYDRDADQKIFEQVHVPVEPDHERLLSELRIHQIELEIQNKELRESQTRLEFLQRQYTDLYNMAPIGYASLDDKGIIIRCNLTFADMLNSEPAYIKGRALAQFIERADQALYHSRFRAFIKSPEDKHIDVNFVKQKAGLKTGGSRGFVGRIQGRRIDRGVSSERIWQETLLVVVSDITVLKKTEDRIHHQAFHDSLTGLPNRSSLTERATSALALARRQKHIGAMLFMDMDRFKTINDSLGHQVGDELLISFSERLSKHLRKEDMLARLGGDEFVILLGEQHHDRVQMANIAERVANNIVQILQQPLLAQGHKIQVEVSLGIALFPEHENDSALDVLRKADTAMYQAKGNKQSRIVFFDDRMQQKAFHRLNLETQLREALNHDQFELYYQPQVKPDGQIRAVEALIRWHHPDHGLMLPAQFISVAEETGLIVFIGDWVLKETIRQLVRWREMGLCTSGMEVAINISPRQLQSEHFSSRVEDFLDGGLVDTSCLAFEITESLLLPNDKGCEVQLKRLSDLGLMLSVDDFGTGYSSLSVLRQAPVGQLKIDRKFITGLDDEDRAKKHGNIALVRLIISMAREMGMQVVAEGVETRQQLQVLKELNCDLIQGFLFSPPVPAKQVEALLFQKVIEVVA